MTKEEMLKKVDDMTIYEKDFLVIKNLLANADSNFFVRVLEEVIEGNLYWSDFDRLLSETKYTETLEENIKIQSEMYNEIIKLSEFRKSLNNKNVKKSTNLYSEDASLTNIGLIPSSDNEEMRNFYIEERINARDNLIYSMLNYSPNDTEVTRACKDRLLNAIENGKILENKKFTEQALASKNIIVKSESSTITVGTDVYEFIDPNDILFSVDDFVIPLDYKYQTLSDSDKNFMAINNINEIDMKKMKSISEFLRREQILNKIK